MSTTKPTVVASLLHYIEISQFLHESGCIYCLFHSLHQWTHRHTAATEAREDNGDDNEDDSSRVST